MATTDLWTYRDATLRGNALVGYNVEATDGEIGKVDAATDDYIIVDTGTLIFGKKMIVPAGVIERVDLDAEIVYVGRTRTASRTPPSTTRTVSARRRIGPSWASTTADLSR